MIGQAAEEAFIQALEAGEFPVEPLEGEDIARTLALIRQNADLRLGFVDATIVAIAERLDIREILTTDRRHFGTVRPQHARAFTLVP